MTQITNLVAESRPGKLKSLIRFLITLKRTLRNPHSLKLNEHCNLWGFQNGGLRMRFFKLCFNNKKFELKKNKKSVLNNFVYLVSKICSRIWEISELTASKRWTFRLAPTVSKKEVGFVPLWSFWVLAKVIFGVSADFAYLKKWFWKVPNRGKREVLHFKFANWDLIFFWLYKCTFLTI